MSLLKEFFVLSEVTVEVPEEDMPGLQRAVLAAVKAGELPKSATRWARTADSAARAAARDQGRFKKRETEPGGGDGEPVDEPEERPVAKKAAPVAPKKEPAKVVAKARTKKSPPTAPERSPYDFPDLPAPKSANVQVGGDDSEGGYRSPFGHLSGGSSWDNVPAWLRDPEMMPHHGGGSQRIPRSPEGGPEDAPGRLPDKRPGLLHRIFGGGRR